MRIVRPFLFSALCSVLFAVVVIPFICCCCFFAFKHDKLQHSERVEQLKETTTKKRASKLIRTQNNKQHTHRARALIRLVGLKGASAFATNQTKCELKEKKKEKTKEYEANANAI